MGIVQQITDGISISVEATYQPEQSNPYMLDYWFTYKIIIQNLSEMPVRLLRRHWYIQDAHAILREVDGEGVVGKQPVLSSGSEFSYMSAANLRTEMGRMWGYFTMENEISHQQFPVVIPVFDLLAPFKLN